MNSSSRTMKFPAPGLDRTEGGRAPPRLMTKMKNETISTSTTWTTTDAEVVAARIAEEVVETAAVVVPTAAVKLAAVVPVLPTLIAVLLDNLIPATDVVDNVVPAEVVVVELLRVMTQDVVTLLASI